MVQLLVDFVEFHPHLAQGGDEFPLDVPGLFLWHETSKHGCLKRLVDKGFGNAHPSVHGDGATRRNNKAMQTTAPLASPSRVGGIGSAQTICYTAARDAACWQLSEGARVWPTETPLSYCRAGGIEIQAP